jgi:hypothetical protein
MDPWGDDVPIVHVDNFSYGLLNPVLGYLMSCLGAFIGLRCVTRARAYQGLRIFSFLALIVIMLTPSEEEILADVRLSERLAERPVSHRR